MRTNRILSAALVACGAVGLSTSAYATNGYQLIGVGQYQKGVGGAVTAAPQSAMTAITNPAGMARIGNRADYSMELFQPKRYVDFTDNGGEKTEGGSEQYGVPAIGWTAPAFDREGWFFGGGMYGTSGLGVDYGESTYMPGAALDQQFGAPSGTYDDVTFDGYSAIQFWKAAPTVAYTDDNYSVGFALNLDYQSVTIRQTFRNVPFWNNPANPSAGVTQRDVNFDLGRPTNSFGYGATIGGMYDITDMVTVGVMYSTKQEFGEQEYRVGTNDILNYNGARGVAGKYKLDLDYPSQAALGVAVRPISGLTVSADVKWIGWSATHDEVDLEGPANSFDSDGDGTGDTDSTTLNFGWEDQVVYALGVDYDVMPSLTVRAGFNYAEAPIDQEDVFNNLIFPATVETHYSLGATYRFGEHWEVTGAYMVATENTLEGKDDVPEGFQQTTPFREDSGAEIGLKETSLGVQLGYRF